MKNTRNAHARNAHFRIRSKQRYLYRPLLQQNRQLVGFTQGIDGTTGFHGIADHVNVGDFVKIGSKSGLDKDVPDGEVRFGYPALPGMQYHRSAAVFKRLPELEKLVHNLEKQLAELKK